MTAAERQHKYYIKNREKIQNYRREYQRINKEKLKTQASAYHRTGEFKVHQAEYEKEYRKTPIGIYHSIKKNIHLRDYSLEFSAQEFKEWYLSQSLVCVYCGIDQSDLEKDPIQTKKYNKRLSIDRIDNNLGYTIRNIQLCCYRCNCIKGDLFNHEDMLVIGKIVASKRSTK